MHAFVVLHATIINLSAQASKNAMFQASVAIGIMSVSYYLHAKHQPFVSLQEQERLLGGSSLRATPSDAAAGSSGGKAMSPSPGPTPRSRQRRRAVSGGANSALAIAAAAAAASMLENVDALMDFNLLETVRLRMACACACHWRLVSCGELGDRLYVRKYKYKYKYDNYL